LDGEVWQARKGTTSADDFRFARLWFEAPATERWVDYAKGGPFSPFHIDVSMKINWMDGAKELRAFPPAYIRNEPYNYRPGLSWPIKNRFSFKARILPARCIFSHVSSSIFHSLDSRSDLLSLLAVTSSSVFSYLIQSISGWNFEVGSVQSTPVPDTFGTYKERLAELGLRGWRIAREHDLSLENSRSFILPLPLLQRSRQEVESQPSQNTLEQVIAEIDQVAWRVYEASPVFIPIRRAVEDSDEQADDEDADDASAGLAADDSLISWAVGVAFGRFDWRLATGEREDPPEPDPFDPLPAKSPGMRPDGAAPFHDYSGILVDDQGHAHDLPRLIEEVLTRVKADVPGDVRRWLQRDFFPLHLKQYSKSRRKAPIYWPLSTSSGSYTLWLYYPSVTSQTLYTAVNDFVEPKLKQVSRDTATLRDKGAARSRDDEKAFEALQTVELELIELRDTLLQIAPTYRPNHDDGVQITAAPLWQLFRHKPWQKILKDTWAKLEKGDYDWAHLAMAYWPDRVREKCKTDKSLAIAHDLENLYVEPKPQPKKARGRKKAGGDE
jgi:hypothetical protein